MKIKYVHTNIVARNYKKLSNFYCSTLGCKPVLPERNLSGEWIDKGTAIKNAHIKGIHLRLPGYEKDGPTLEIFEYTNLAESASHKINKLGIAHIAFSVENIAEVADLVINNGGSALGEIVSNEISGVGIVTFCYMRDPEENIIELQSWKK